MLQPTSPIDVAREGHRLDDRDALTLADEGDLDALVAAAGELRDRGHGGVVSYSRKVFVPLTHLCRDVCHYCTFARPPRRGERAFMTPDEVLAVAREGQAAGCREALFTLGDKPELRYRRASEELEELGFATTLDYLAHVADLVWRETGLIPHLNPGVMTDEELARLRPVSASMGLMMESLSERLCERGGPHWGSPDKRPSVRLATLDAAGRAAVPFTTGILIGIGETRRERVETLLSIRRSHEVHGHIQEIIVQNFRAKPGTRMADAPEPDTDELVWTIAVTRLLFGAEANVQAPPNLSPGATAPLIAAGINDWGGVSPVTPDYVNPEAPWPHVERLAAETAATGKHLVERLTIYPAWARDGERWLDTRFRTPVMHMVDAAGFPRTDDWSPGETLEPPEADLARVVAAPAPLRILPDLGRILDKPFGGIMPSERDIARLFHARGEEISAVARAADALRAEVNGDVVTYVVNRNINYTNVCYFRCQFCAFSKGKTSENLRGRPYVVPLDEIARRASEAWERGATEVCMQGGIHPAYTGQTYIDICHAVKDAVPDMHVHAFSPLEVHQGAATLGIPVREFLLRLKDAGLGTLPGTAAEILDDEVRRIICPDKLTTDLWLEGMEAAHDVGFQTTATIMYGHVERPEHWARHLVRIRDLQARTGGFTEFVPLPFVAMEAPLYLKGRARRGPTFREALLMHSVARLALHPVLTTIQTSWVKMGRRGLEACLGAGANDLGGTLMNESITRAAGAAHGEELPPEHMEEIVCGLGRRPVQRTTDYRLAPNDQVERSRHAAPLSPVVNPTARDFERRGEVSTLARPGFDT